MTAANDLFQSLKDFGWPILAYAIFSPISTFVLPSNRSREEQVQRLLFVGAIIAAIEMLFFLGTESNNALQVARINPGWGVSVLLLILVVIAFGAWQWSLNAKENRVDISIGGHSQKDVPMRKVGRGFYLVLICFWIIGAVGSVFWLSRIAVGSPAGK